MSPSSLLLHRMSVPRKLNETTLGLLVSWSSLGACKPSDPSVSGILSSIVFSLVIFTIVTIVSLFSLISLSFSHVKGFSITLTLNSYKYGILEFHGHDVPPHSRQDTGR